jgi:hypothetical protein
LEKNREKDHLTIYTLPKVVKELGDENIKSIHDYILEITSQEIIQVQD